MGVLAAIVPSWMGARVTIREAMVSYGLSADFGHGLWDRFIGRLTIPPPFIPVLGRVQLVNVSLASVSTVQTVIKNALHSKKIILSKPGTTALEGAIPRTSSGG